MSAVSGLYSFGQNSILIKKKGKRKGDVGVYLRAPGSIQYGGRPRDSMCILVATVKSFLLWCPSLSGVDIHCMICVFVLSLLLGKVRPSVLF